jgi:hypothetical protein
MDHNKSRDETSEQRLFARLPPPSRAAPRGSQEKPSRVHGARSRGRIQLTPNSNRKLPRLSPPVNTEEPLLYYVTSYKLTLEEA